MCCAHLKRVPICDLSDRPARAPRDHCRPQGAHCLAAAKTVVLFIPCLVSIITFPTELKAFLQQAGEYVAGDPMNLL